MALSTRGGLLPLLALTLVAMAVLGYTAGYRSAPVASSVAHREAARTALGTSLMLEYPAGWRRTAAVAAVPGLPVAHPLLLAPGGNSAHAGLLSGQLPGGEPTPLPERFLERVHGAPRTEVVNITYGQALRYSRLSIPGSERVFELYVVMYTGKSPTVLACYAAKGYTAYLSQCQQIVTSLTPIGQSSMYGLTPNASYAHRLGVLIETLNTQRLTLRREMRALASATAARRLAGALADRFATAAVSLAELQPPRMVGPAQTDLAESILRARAAYTALAASTAAGQTEYGAALKQVNAAEAGVNAALEDLALLGYSHSQRG